MSYIYEYIYVMSYITHSYVKLLATSPPHTHTHTHTHHVMVLKARDFGR